MLEAILNTPFTTVVSGPTGTPLTDVFLYLNGAASGITPTVTQIGSSNVWRVVFTPTSTGEYSLFGFQTIQFRVTCVPKSLYSFLTNVEDEALGSWTWNKETGVLTVLRQNGSVLATHNMLDNLTSSSRERVS